MAAHPVQQSPGASARASPRTRDVRVCASPAPRNAGERRSPPASGAGRRAPTPALYPRVRAPTPERSSSACYAGEGAASSPSASRPAGGGRCAAAVKETTLGAPLSSGCMGVLFPGAEAVAPEVVCGRHLDLRLGTTPSAAMDGPFELLRVPPNSVLACEVHLVRCLPKTTHEINVIRNEALLRSGDCPNKVFATAAPGFDPSADTGGNAST